MTRKLLSLSRFYAMSFWILISFIPSAHSAIFDVILNFNSIVSNNAGFSISVCGTSNGGAFCDANPTSGQIYQLSSLGDFLDVTVAGNSSSAADDDPAFAGRSNSSLQSLIRFGEDYGGGSGNDPTGQFGLLWVAAIAMSWDIDASGTDAYTNAGQNIQRGADIIASNNCLSDTLFGDNLNGVDLGTFGSPCTGNTNYSLLSSEFPLQATSGESFANVYASNDSQSFASSGTYTTTMRFGISEVVVPLPATGWLFVSALIGLAGARRRKQS